MLHRQLNHKPIKFDLMNCVFSLIEEVLSEEWSESVDEIEPKVQERSESVDPKVQERSESFDEIAPKVFQEWSESVDEVKPEN